MAETGSSNNVMQQRSAALYIGDLQKTVNEGEIQDQFKDQHVTNVRVCRDINSGDSLGQGYINFSSVGDAERALQNENYKVIKGQEFRLMWQQRDPSSRFMGKNNLIVRNLPKHFGTKDLASLFSKHGNIVSCKISKNSKGGSEGFGFVQYDKPEAIQTAIDELNGKTPEGGDRELLVSKFERSEIRHKSGVESYNNLYVKNFNKEWSEDQVNNLFAKYGKILSAKLDLDEEGKSKGQAFVCFENADDAKKACEELHNKDLDGMTLYVSKFMKKSERRRLLKQEMDKRNKEGQKTIGNNLQVKYLDETCTEAELKELFIKYGEITSVKIETTDYVDAEGNNKSISKGVGYVAFATQEHAAQACSEMNGKTVSGKPLQVAMHMKKSWRQQQMNAFLNNQMVNQPMMNNMLYQQQMMRNNQYRGMQGMQMPMNPMMGRGNPMMMQGGYGSQNQMGNRGRGAPQGQRGRMQQPGSYPRGAQGGGDRGKQQMNMVPQARNINQGGGQPQQQGAKNNMQTYVTFDVNHQEGIKNPKDKKQYLGECIYPIVYAKEQEYAGKITGMLLEMDGDQLIEIINNSTVLHEKIDEAINVLKRYKANPN